MKETYSYPESRLDTRRINREKKTISIMIDMYCSVHHSTKCSPCNECQHLLDYAKERLDKCPLKDDKPTCAKCTVHCYKQDMREKTRQVMKYSGPRMVVRHPMLAFHHLIDGRHKAKGGIKNDRGTKIS